MNKRWIPFMTSAMLLAALASAQPMAGPSPMGGGRRAALLVDVLQPTAEQLSTWKQLRTDTAAAMKPLAQTARDLRKQIDTAMSVTSPDAAAIGKLTLALGTTRQSMKTLGEDAKAKFAATLSPEQKTKFEALEAARGSMRHRRQGAMGMAPR